MIRSLFRSRLILLIAFAFAVMGDPVSSVAYAIEAALRALHGDLALLVVTMGIVLAVITLISVNYHQLYARFPEGGGAVAGSTDRRVASLKENRFLRSPESTEGTT